jgi:transcriptional regulator with XRE-family HTH domain
MMNLKSYLKANGITQEQFASRVGVTQGSLSKIASGPEANISLDTALKIEDATSNAFPVTYWKRFAALANRGAKR